MQISINIEDDSVAKKILWFLEHFKDDGIEVTNNSVQENKQVYTDQYVKENWRELAYKASGNPEQEDDEVLRENYGKYLNAKHTL